MDTIIDIDDYTPVENQIYLTAPDVAREINDDEKRVRHWGDAFGDIKQCGVFKINGRKKYTPQTIEAFKFIKELIDNKGFSHAQIRDYIQRNGFKNENDEIEGLVNTNDPLGYQALATALTVECRNLLDKYNNDTQAALNNFANTIMETITTQVALTVDDVISEKMEQQKKELLEELSITKETNEKIDLLKSMMEERKKENTKKRNWWRRIRGE